MQQYVVGGAVRDVLLNIVPKDIDYVWTGVTPDFLKDKGWEQVGANFPVFLDEYDCEHALARIERKTGEGYLGFECQFDTSITIEQDLSRRDLTINSMAVKVEDWESFKISKSKDYVIDPYNGISDLHNKKIKHTSNAFSEDPLRILRAMRFAARYAFNIDSATRVLMRALIEDNQLSYLSKERIWKELLLGIQTANPDRFITLMHSYCILTKITDHKFADVATYELYTNMRSATLFKLSIMDMLAIIFMRVGIEDIEKLLVKLTASNDVIKYVKKFIMVNNFLTSIDQSYFFTGKLSVPMFELFNKLNIFKEYDDLVQIVKLRQLLHNFSKQETIHIGLLHYASKIKDINFSSLTDEQKTTLKNTEIKDAINELRINNLISY